MIELIEHNQPALAELCRQFKVRRLDLFGSAATGAFDAEMSDLDFVVSFADTTPGTYADRYLNFAEALEHLFQRKGTTPAAPIAAGRSPNGVFG